MIYPRVGARNGVKATYGAPWLQLRAYTPDLGLANAIATVPGDQPAFTLGLHAMAWAGG